MNGRGSSSPTRSAKSARRSSSQSRNARVARQSSSLYPAKQRLHGWFQPWVDMEAEATVLRWSAGRPWYRGACRCARRGARCCPNRPRWTRTGTRTRHTPARAPRWAHRRDRVRGWLGGVAGWFGVVAAPGGRGPPEGAVGELVDLPFRLLLEPVVAVLGGQGIQRDDQVRPAAGGAQPPGSVPARRAVTVRGGEGEPRPIPRPEVVLILAPSALPRRLPAIAAPYGTTLCPRRSA